jgi:hypothetical protein
MDANIVSSAFAALESNDVSFNNHLLTVNLIWLGWSFACGVYWEN